MSKRKGKRKKNPNKRRVPETKAKYCNIYSRTPKKLLYEEYVKNLFKLVYENKPIEGFSLSADQMEEFSPILGKLTTYEKKKSFDEVYSILNVEWKTIGKDNRRRTEFKNLEEMITPEGVAGIINFLKENFSNIESTNRSENQVSVSFVQASTVLKLLWSTKHIRELTISNPCLKIFVELLSSENLGKVETILVLDHLLVQWDIGYIQGLGSLRRRYRSKKQREQRKKERREKKKEEKREAKEEKERLKKKKKQKNPKKTKKDKDESDSESEAEDSESEEEEEEGEEEEDQEEINEENRFKKAQAKATIKDEELYEAIQNIRERMTSEEFFLSLANVLSQAMTIPDGKGNNLENQVITILVLRILGRILAATFEDRKCFEYITSEIILGKSNFVPHFETILSEFTKTSEDSEKTYEDADSDSETPLIMMKNRECLSCVLAVLYRIAEDPSNKIHRKLKPCYESLIQILQIQSKKFESSRTETSPSKSLSKSPKSPKSKKKVSGNLDWSLVCALCQVLSKLGAKNPLQAKFLSEYLFENMINLLEYASIVNIVNLEVYSLFNVLISHFSCFELMQYFEQFNILNIVVSDFLKKKHIVEMYYPPLLCLKVIIEKFTKSSHSRDQIYCMKFVTRNLKFVEKIFRIGNQTEEWREEMRERMKEEQEKRLEEEKKKKMGKRYINNTKKKKRKKTKTLSEEEMIHREKVELFAVPCILTTIHVLYQLRVKLNSIIVSGNEDASSVLEGVEKYDKLVHMDKFEHVQSLLQLSKSVSQQKKKEFSYKWVLILFVVIIVAILIIPQAIIRLGISTKAKKNKDGWDDHDEEGNDEI